MPETHPPEFLLVRCWFSNGDFLPADHLPCSVNICTHEVDESMYHGYSMYSGVESDVGQDRLAPIISTLLTEAGTTRLCARERGNAHIQHSCILAFLQDGQAAGPIHSRWQPPFSWRWMRRTHRRKESEQKCTLLRARPAILHQKSTTTLSGDDASRWC